MPATQPINVTVPVCSRCRREVLCESCGKSPATQFDIGYISDELTMTPQDLCTRCYLAWRVPPEERDADEVKAATATEVTNRNFDRYFHLKKKGSPTEGKDGH